MLKPHHKVFYQPLKTEHLALIIGILLIVISCVYFSLQPKFDNRTVLIGSNKLTVEMAVSPEQKKLGLGGRCTITNDTGMDFVFDNPETPLFTMEHMRLPLDILWIRDGQVIDIAHDLPKGGKTLYKPLGPIDHAIEVPAGWAAAHGVTLGTTVADMVQ